MPTFEIPTSPNPETFNISLGGVTYQFTLHWSVPANAWVIDIASVSGVSIVTGIPLVADIDLLAQYPDLGFGGQLIASTNNAPGIPPTFENLGSLGHLYFITT